MTEYLPMRDPCPHVTRIDIIRARLHGQELELRMMLEHVADCNGDDDSD